LTRSARARTVRHPHPTHQGTAAREGHGETRPRTGRASEDRARGGCDVRRRRERSPDGPHRHDRQEECLDRPRDPLPTRVDLAPLLPTAYDDALDTGLAALGLTLTGHARAAIDGHVRLLLAWNEAINLTAIRDPAEIAIRHVVDSLTGIRILEARRIRRVVDLGSGGGFPGLPVAAVLGGARVRLIESVAKKARFLQAAVDATGLAGRVEVHPVRAETLAVDRARTGRWDAVTARAVAPLADLVELAFPLLGPHACLVAWKSASAVTGANSELAAARRAIAAIDPAARLEVEPAIPPATAGREAALAPLADHRLVVVSRGAGPISGRWPRDPAARRRAPW
jgi:16S rRNA (guanine527-N7)-methyltransferase